MSNYKSTSHDYGNEALRPLSETGQLIWRRSEQLNKAVENVLVLVGQPVEQPKISMPKQPEVETTAPSQIEDLRQHVERLARTTEEGEQNVAEAA